MQDTCNNLFEEGVHKKNARLILESVIPTLKLGRFLPSSPGLFPDRNLEEARIRRYILSRSVEENQIDRKSFLGRIKNWKWDKQAEKDAKQGDMHGQMAHGMNLIVKGDKVEEGIRWIKRAIEQGNIEAIALLGQIYFEGINIRRDNSEAINYFKKASDRGDNRSTTLLAIAHLYGLGTTADLEKAAKLLKKADKQADFVAGCLLPEIESRLLSVKKMEEITKAVLQQDYHGIIKHLNTLERFAFDEELQLLSGREREDIDEEIYPGIVSKLGPKLMATVIKAIKQVAEIQTSVEEYEPTRP